MWVMDSGASMHISIDVTNFLTLELNPRFALPTVTFGNNHNLTATGNGTVKFLLPGVDGPSTTMILEDVLYTPIAAANLFSVKQPSGYGQAVVFSGDRCYIYKDHILLSGLSRTRTPTTSLRSLFPVLCPEMTSQPTPHLSNGAKTLSAQHMSIVCVVSPLKRGMQDWVTSA
jgi:hypothetical protein